MHSQCYGHLAWNCLPKEIRLCGETEAFKRNLNHLFVKFVHESSLAIWFWRIIVKRPRMLSAQFVAQYKPCKPVLYWHQDNDMVGGIFVICCIEIGQNVNLRYNRWQELGKNDITISMLRTVDINSTKQGTETSACTYCEICCIWSKVSLPESITVR